MVVVEVEEFGSPPRVYAQLHFGFSMMPEASFIVAVKVLGLHLCTMHTSER